MNSESAPSQSVTPTRFTSFLKSLVGHRIVRAIRYSWWSPEESEQKCGVRGQDVFSLTAGPIVFEIDTGVIIGLASDPSINSVIIWIEQNETGQSMRDEPLTSDKDLHPISASDQNFADPLWWNVVGASIVTISVLVRIPSSARLAELPNEVGLCFTLDSGMKIVAAHGLHDDSDDFVVIPDYLILDTLRADLRELPIG